MATNAQGKASAGDFTGRLKADLEEKHAEELKARGDEIARTIAAEKEIDETKVTDVTIKASAPVVVDEVSVVASEDEGTVIIRVNEDLKQVTIGTETYDFVAGRKYKVPANVAFVLEERGRVWH